MSTAAACCLLLAAAGRLQGQAAADAGGGAGRDGSTTLTELHYENGRVLEPWLPYSRRFVISGSPVTFRGRADVVWGRIYEERDTSRVITSSCWVRPDNAATDARFRTVYDRLTLGREYRVRLSFAQKINAGVLTRGVRRGLRHATNTAETEEGIGNDLVSSAVAEGIRTQVASELGTHPLYIQITNEGECGTTDVLQVRLAPEDDLKLRRAVGARLQERAAFDRLGTALRALDAMSDATVDSLAAALAAARANSSNTSLVYTVTDIQALRNAFRSRNAEGSGLDANIVARLDSALRTPTPTPRELVTHATELQRLIAMVDQVRLTEVALKTATAETVRLNAQVDSVAPQVQGQFIAISEASVVETSWGAETEVRKLQIGTAVNGASVFFNPDGANRDAVMMAALRFYLGPVDRSLPEPWSSPRARAALDIGALFQSDLVYRGQKQSGLFTSITPALGVSYDLTRYISLTGGIMFFRQPSINPLAAGSSSHVRRAAYLGVGTDFDALNQLNGLLTKK